MFSISSSNCCCVRFSVPYYVIVSIGNQGRKDVADLKSKMLEEVGGTIGLVRFCAAAGIYPNTNGRCLGPRGVLSGDLEDIISLCQSN
jgi:hypothetical protein